MFILIAVFGHTYPSGFWPFLTLTCRVLWGDGPSVEHLPIPGDGPHLVGSADGDGLERLVGAHVEPGAALRAAAGVTLKTSHSTGVKLWPAGQT